MPRTRVFISHSARDGRADEVRAAIRRKLEATREEITNDPKYAVLMDDLSLEPGDAWRARINLWIGSCDVAIVIVSPDALIKPWVPYELSILGYRRWKDPNFRIIPVFVDVTMAEVAASALAPTQAAEWFGILEGTNEEIAARIVDKLVGVVPAGHRPIERMAEILDAHLPDTKLFLDDAAAALGIELQWDAQHSQRFCLALQILGSGMTDACAVAVAGLRRDPTFKEKSLDEIIRLVSCAWVGLTSDQLADLLLAQPPPALALNAGFAETVETFLRAASYRKQPMLDCVNAEPKTVLEERDDEDVYLEEVLGAVRTTLDAELETTTKEARDEALEFYARARKPVVMIIPARAVNLAIVTKLQNEFKHVTFFLLLGQTANLAAVPQPVHVIRPPLTDNDETKCRNQKKDFRRLVNLKMRRDRDQHPD